MNKVWLLNLVHDFVENEYNGKVTKIVFTKEIIYRSTSSQRIEALKKNKKMDVLRKKGNEKLMTR